MTVSKKPRLSINCITYNQEKFIRQTLDGFLMQKTNFPFVIYISDDASTDKTPEIIKEYAEKYPDIVKPLLRQVNVGGPRNYLENLQRADCEYFANCEGDDYWTDPLKLQKQVDFLDAHPDYSVCFHLVREVWEDNSGKKDQILPEPFFRFFKDEFDIHDLLQHNFIHGANTVVYRWRFNRSNCKVEDNFPLNIEPGDWYLHLLHAEVGKVKFLNEEMSVYRRHPGGIWYGSHENDEFYIRNGLKHIKFYIEAKQRFHGDFSKEIDNIASRVIMAAISHKNFTLLQNFSEIYPDIFTANYEKVKILFAALNSPTIKKAIRKQIDHFRLLAKFAVGRKKKRYQEKYKLLKSTYKSL